MNWFRLYAEARNDAKLRSLSDSQHRVWFNLLCLASEGDDRGEITEYDEDVLALEVANGDGVTLRDTLERLQKLRIITVSDGTIRFTNFVKRQYDKPSAQPSATAERKRRSRAKQEPRDQGVTAPPGTPETTLSRRVTPSHAHTQNRTENTQSRAEQTTVAPAAPPSSPGTTPNATIAAAPPSPNEPYRLFQALCDETGADETAATNSEKGKQLGVAKHLLADGVTETDVRGCVRYLQSQSWRTSIIDLTTVRSEIGKWQMAGRPNASPLPQRIVSNGRHASRTDEHQAKIRRALELAQESP